MEFECLFSQDETKFKQGFNALLQAGWSPFGETSVSINGDKLTLYQGFMRSNSDAEEEMGIAERFVVGYANLDQKLKDLLDINGIALGHNGTDFTVTCGNETSILTPFKVVSLLVNAKHCPIDLNEQWVLDEIQENF